MIKTMEEVALQLIKEEVAGAVDIMFDDGSDKFALERLGFIRGVIACVDAINAQIDKLDMTEEDFENKDKDADTECGECEITF